MEKGLNFKTIENQNEYFKAYENSLTLLTSPMVASYVSTSYGKSYVLCSGNEQLPPLVLLHAASCGSPIWYKNIAFWSNYFNVYAIDLIGESSKSILTKKLKTPYDNAVWLDETLQGLNLDYVYLCGLSIGGWTAANYAGYFPQRVLKLILLSPVQTFAKMHKTYFIKIMNMGFHPTRENVERYIGWGNEKEGILPDCIIKQFTLSVMNLNANASFPKYLKAELLQAIKMPVLVMFGENEFAFSLHKAVKRAHSLLRDVDVQILKEASHLLAVSQANCINHAVVSFINK